jgi:hypothetical protein
LGEKKECFQTDARIVMVKFFIVLFAIIGFYAPWCKVIMVVLGKEHAARQHESQDENAFSHD